MTEQKFNDTCQTWVDEEDFFEARRRDPKLEIIEKKWSEGSSPIILIRYGYIAREEWEKCFWIKHPSEARCWECPHSGVCPSYTKGEKNE